MPARTPGSYIDIHAAPFESAGSRSLLHFTCSDKHQNFVIIIISVLLISAIGRCIGVKAIHLSEYLRRLTLSNDDT